MKVIERKCFDTDALRSMCIRYNWYTRGSNDSYSKMFELAESFGFNVGADELYQVASDIFIHTNVESAKTGCCSSYTDEENIFNMMTYINDCTIVFYERG